MDDVKFDFDDETEGDVDPEQRKQALWRDANPEYTRKWRAANPEYDREWRAVNRDKINEKMREWRAANPEKMREWRAANLEKTREWRAANPEKTREYARKWRAANPEKARAQWECQAAIRSVARNTQLALQQGLCAICGESPKNPSYDHDHETGVYRGVLCNRCNTKLGHIEKPFPPEYLAYLEKYGGWIHGERIEPGGHRR